jgi:hypothetical protein
LIWSDIEQKRSIGYSRGATKFYIGERSKARKLFPMRPPIVSLGLYGGSRTQDGGDSSCISREWDTNRGRKRGL